MGCHSEHLSCHSEHLSCHSERTGPRTSFRSGVVSRRTCGCSSMNFKLATPGWERNDTLQRPDQHLAQTGRAAAHASRSDLHTPKPINLPWCLFSLYKIFVESDPIPPFARQGSPCLVVLFQLLTPAAARILSGSRYRCIFLLILRIGGRNPA